MKRRKFIETCACCAIASFGAMLTGEGCKNYIIRERQKSFALRDVGIHLSEHCNLKCKYCGHFSCIAEKEFYDLDKFRQDMKIFSSLFSQKLLDIQLMGGEPLLNPKINEYIKISRECFPEKRIIVFTNGLLLNDMDESFWKTLNKYDVWIRPCLYPIEINWKPVIAKARKYNVGLYADDKQKIRLSLKNIEKFRKLTFSKMALVEDGNYDNSNCIRKYGCNSMYDGKFYPCTTIAYVRHFNKKYNKNFIVTKEDYLDLYKVRDLSEVDEFLSKPRYHFCKYCGNGGGEVKWEHSPIHDISEWT